MFTINNLAKISMAMTIGAVTALMVVSIAQSEGIDWESSINVGNSLSTNGLAQDNNLPGVNSVPSAVPNNRQTDCNDLVPGSSQIGGDQIAAAQCRRKKKPLIVLRENQVGGLLFEFPR